LIGRNRANLIVGWCGRFLFFVVPRQFSPDIGEWPENQILIPDWTYFYCPGATLLLGLAKNQVFSKTKVWSVGFLGDSLEARSRNKPAQHCLKLLQLYDRHASCMIATAFHKLIPPLCFATRWTRGVKL